MAKVNSLGNTSLRGFGGMASGIDRDAMIEAMTAGTTSKITTQRNKMQTLQWKQEAYQSVSGKIIDLDDKYFTYSSSKCLKSASLFARNQITAIGDATDGRFPVIAVWENVMGSLSSSDRLDFAAVLQAFTDADIPIPASGGWAHAGMVRGRGPDLCWRLMDAQYWASPRLARRQRIFIVADFGGRRAHEILFKPRPMFQVSPPRGEGGMPAAQDHRGPVIETGGRVPVVRPFQMFRMRGAANDRYHVQFRDSFGFADDPFPTLLAGGVAPFAFWYEDDPLGGCIRFPTELESERLMGLPDGWTKYGADGRKINSAQRYRALGNSIALPCAGYIMAGISEDLSK